MIAITLQCPSCGLRLGHSERLLSRVEGRRGTTRCPRCRDRVTFDATGDSLRISFPDLYRDAEAHSSRNIAAETAAPPEVSEDRASGVVERPTLRVPPSIPAEALADARLPLDLLPDEEDLPALVFPLLKLKRLRYGA